MRQVRVHIAKTLHLFWFAALILGVQHRHITHAAATPESALGCGLVDWNHATCSAELATTSSSTKFELEGTLITCTSSLTDLRQTFETLHTLSDALFVEQNLPILARSLQDIPPNLYLQLSVDDAKVSAANPLLYATNLEFYFFENQHNAIQVHAAIRLPGLLCNDWDRYTTNHTQLSVNERIPYLHYALAQSPGWQFLDALIKKAEQRGLCFVKPFVKP